MMKKSLCVIFICLALLVCASGALLMPFDRQDGASEKRILAPFPEFLSGGAVNLSFPMEFEGWLNDHIGGRRQLTSFYSRLLTAIGTSPNAQVIVGKEGWLFFRETVPDYTGEGALSEDELYRLDCVLRQINDALAGNGVKFILAIAPNKSTIYPQYMPDAYPHADVPGNAARLMALGGVRFVDWASLLLEHANEDLYYRGDTHWNERGARYAAAALIRAVAGRKDAAPMPDPGAPFRFERDYVGDLTQMLYPVNAPREDRIVFEDGTPQQYRYTGRMRTLEDINISTEGGASPLRVLMLRDSFANSLIGWVSNAFSSVDYSRQMPLPLQKAGEYDIVVLQIVERRLRELLDDAPVLFASPADLFPADENGVGAVAFAKLESGGVRIWGEVDAAPARVTECVVQIIIGDRIAAYYAYPVGGEAGFSLLIPSLEEGATVAVRFIGDEMVTSRAVSVLFE